MDRFNGSGYNAAVESFREEEYPMLRGTNHVYTYTALSLQ